MIQILLLIIFIFSNYSTALAEECKATLKVPDINLSVDKLIHKKIDVDFINSFNNKESKIDGPNCAWTALRAIGFLSTNTPFNYDPGDLKQQLPDCFKKVGSLVDADVIIYFDKSGNLYHIAIPIDSQTVFSKNGLQKSVPYKIQSIDEMTDFYLKHHPENPFLGQYFKFSPTDKCKNLFLNKKMDDIISDFKKQENLKSDYEIVAYFDQKTAGITSSETSVDGSVLSSFIKSYVDQKWSDTNGYNEYYLDQHIKKFIRSDLNLEKLKKIFRSLDESTNLLVDKLMKINNFKDLIFKKVELHKGYHYPEFNSNLVETSFCIYSDPNNKNENKLEEIQKIVDDQNFSTDEVKLKFKVIFCTE